MMANLQNKYSSPTKPIYFELSELKFKQLTESDIIYDESCDYIIPELDELSTKLSKTKDNIEIISQKQWKRVSHIVQSYCGLATIVEEYCNAQFCTGAWLKMFEILKLTDIISYTKEQCGFKTRIGKIFVKTFSTCELPGAFLSAISHIMKTENTDTIHHWYAQSLRPIRNKNSTTDNNNNSNTNTDTKGILPDQFNIVDKYRRRWLWGATGTGDITDIKNIKSYANAFKLRQVSLVTSDCGLNVSDDYNNQELKLDKTNLGQILTAISTLVPKGSCILKMFTFFKASTVSYLRLLYDVFDDIHLVKPLCSKPCNSEIYIVCKGFKGISRPILNKL